MHDGLGAIFGGRDAIRRKLARRRDPGQALGPRPDSAPQVPESAAAIGAAVAEALRRSPSTPVRPPSHTCPPIRSLEVDEGVRVTAPGYTTVAAGNSATFLTRTFFPAHYAVIVGWAFLVAWDVDDPADPYITAPITLLIDGTPHPEYRDVNVQITTSLAGLSPITLALPPKDTTNGRTIALRVTNNGAQTIRVSGRFRGYQFPISGTNEGIYAGLVEG